MPDNARIRCLKPSIVTILLPIRKAVRQRATVGNYRFRLLDHLLTLPNDLTLPKLQRDPIWDLLHADPAFQKLCQEKQHESSLREGLGKHWRQLGLQAARGQRLITMRAHRRVTGLPLSLWYSRHTRREPIRVALGPVAR